MNREAVRVLVETYYDIQDLRIRTQNRIRAAHDRGVLEEAWVQKLHDRVDVKMRMQEDAVKRMIQAEIKHEPLWVKWLQGVKGIGPCVAGGLLSWAGDCSQFTNVSKLWAYSGLHVVDGAAPKRKKGEKANWNPRLRTLAWKAAKSFVMVGNGYRELYEQEKVRLRRLHPEPESWDPPRYMKKEDDNGKKVEIMHFSDGHVDAMARRKVAKVFFAHYWQMARESAGLDTRSPWVIEHGGHQTEIPVVMD